MDTSGRLSFAQGAAWVIVIGGHLLLILLLSNLRPREIRQPESDAQDRSIQLLDLTPPVIIPPARERRPDRPAVTRAPERPRSEAPEDSTAITLPPGEPSIDWYLEAERVARAAGTEWKEPKMPKCPPSDQPGLLWPECKRPNVHTEWEPEPARAGIDGLLPWVRIGKRCIVGLGFFGCGIGKLPEANGDVFDEMDDPERLRSSVPDVEN